MDTIIVSGRTPPSIIRSNSSVLIQVEWKWPTEVPTVDTGHSAKTGSLSTNSVYNKSTYDWNCTVEDAANLQMIMMYLSREARKWVVSSLFS
jgi:hypothetical protein